MNNKLKKQEWEAYSKYGLRYLREEIYGKALRRGITVRTYTHYSIQNQYFMGGDRAEWLSFECGHIEFLYFHLGLSHLKIVIDESEAEEDFIDFWKSLVDEDLVFDRKYKKKIEFGNNAQTQKQNKSEEDWSYQWIEKVTTMPMRPKERIKYIFLFAVLMCNSEITESTIVYMREKTLQEIDARARTGKTFQDLAKDICSSKKEKNPVVVQDIPAMTGKNLYNNFYLKKKEEFKFPNFPKAA